MTRAAVPPSTVPPAGETTQARPARRGDAIDHWLGMFTRFLRLPHEQSRAIEDELDSHMRERVRDLMLEGLSEDEGMRRAIDELGEAAELAAHFRAAHQPNRRMLMSIAAIGVAAGAAVISVVALSQSQTSTPPAAAPVVAKGGQVEPVAIVGTLFAERETVQRAEGVPMLKDLPIVGSLFVSSGSKVGLTDPSVKLNGKADAPTVRTLAAMLAENAGKRLSLNAGETDVNKPLASVELVEADTATLLRVLNDRAGLIGPQRFDARFKGDVVEVAPLAFFDKQETSLIAYDLSAAMNSHAEVGDLIDTVTQFVESDGWHTNGGDTARLKVVGNKMFVEAPPRYHERVEWIIGQFGTPAPRKGSFAPKAAANHSSISHSAAHDEAAHPASPAHPAAPAHASTHDIQAHAAPVSHAPTPSHAKASAANGHSPFGSPSAATAASPASPVSSSPFGTGLAAPAAAPAAPAAPGSPSPASNAADPIAKP